MSHAAVQRLLDQYDSRALIAWLNERSQDLLGWKVPDAISMYNENVSHIPILVVLAVVYLAVIFSLQWAVRRFNIDLRKNANFNGYALFHNVFMSILSLYMFLDCVLHIYVDDGWSSVDKYFSTGGTAAYLAVQDLFYWSKYIELVDTVILVLKSKKELGFLHLFHHCTTASCSYVTRYQPLWIGVFTNGFIHVFMYAHFARPVSIIRRTLTTGQIVQFLFVMACYNTWWLGYASGVPVKDILYGNFCYAVYLYFFVLFFIDNYIKPKKQVEPGSPVGKPLAHAGLKKEQ